MDRPKWTTITLCILTATPTTGVASMRAGDRGRAPAARRRHSRPGTPHTLHPTPYTLHCSHYTLRPTLYNLHRAPCSLHPTLYTLHYTPFTLYPAPYTLHDDGDVPRRVRRSRGTLTPDP